MRINIQPIALPVTEVLPKTPAKSNVSEFGQMLESLMSQAVQQQTIADAMSTQLALGNTDDVAAVMIAGEKASLSWQLLQQVRNKMLEAFQEIMRMQV